MLESIGERIGRVIESAGLKKVRFAEKLKIDQSYVTQLVNGKRNPSDRTISDICREFNVSEQWLRTGEGEMFVQLSRDEEIAAFVGATLAGEAENFKRRFVAMLAKLDESEWELLEKMIDKIKEG